MASIRRGPGAGDATGASEKNTPRKSKSDNSQASGRAQRGKHEAAENRVPARRAYTLYDGRTSLGTFIWNERTQQALAWTASRRFVGRFGSYKAAARAIGQTAVTARQMAEARRRLDDPDPPFATGLPGHFLRRGWAGPEPGSAMTFAWFVWDAAHRGAIELRRISWEESTPRARPKRRGRSCE
jgi:hypothetical protein